MPDIIKGTKRKTPLSGGGAYVDGGDGGGRTVTQTPPGVPSRSNASSDRGTGVNIYEKNGVMTRAAGKVPALSRDVLGGSGGYQIGRLQGNRSAGSSASGTGASGSTTESAVQEEIKRRVEAAAKILDIDYLLNRRPRVLSGGQRQRVALGRAMVREPVVFLLDEPLSNLDAKMRTELRDQIIRLHERLKTTFVYVTHDQAEAMQMGERLAIMDMGRIVQTGTPQEIYDHPNSVYVAGFVGAPKINFFASHLRRGETGWSIRLLGKTLELPAQRLPLDTEGAEDGMRVILGVRPEDFRLDTSSEPMLQAEALNVLPMGAGLHVQLRCGEVRFLIVLTNHSGVQPGDTLALRVDPWNIQVFDAQTERNLCCPVRKEDAQ